MILTLTPSPSLDLTYEVERLDIGGVTRARATTIDPGGKGINVARALAAAGVEARAIFPAGGPDGARLVALLRELGLTTLATPVEAPTRLNLTLTTANGVTTKVNAPIAPLTAGELDDLISAVGEALADRPRWLVIAGAFPAVGRAHAAPADLAPQAGAHTLPDAGSDVGLQLIARLAHLSPAGTRLALDTSGAALAAGSACEKVALIAPNEAELAQATGRRLERVGDVQSACRSLLSAPDAAALATLGPAGALLVEPQGCWWAGGPPLVARSTVGAGDAALAGYLAAESVGLPPPERLRRAVAWGRAAVCVPGSAVPMPAEIDLDSVRVVGTLDPAAPLATLRS